MHYAPADLKATVEGDVVIVSSFRKPCEFNLATPEGRAAWHRIHRSSPSPPSIEAEAPPCAPPGPWQPESVVMSDRNPPNWKDARKFAELIAGERDPAICVQVFDDSPKKNRDLAGIYDGKLSNPKLQKFIVAKSKRAACGVFLTINKSDGTGRRYETMTYARAAAVDLDKSGLPKKWALEPHIIIKSSPGKYWAFWLLEPTEDFEAWSNCQARLAAFYGGDPSVVDAPRVARFVGFDHMKVPTRPFRTRFIKAPDPADFLVDGFNRLTLAEVADAHPCEYEPPAPRVERGDPAAEPEGGWDKPDNIERAKEYLAGLDPTDAEAFVEHDLFVAACQLKDYGISAELARDMLGELNDRADEPWPEAKLDEKIRNSRKYGQNDAGSKSAEAEFESIEDEAADDFKEVSDEFEKQPILKLNNVNKQNVGKLFKFVNLNGKMRIVYWARSPLDRNVRVPQFWSPREFKMALMNKTYTYKIKTKDDDGNEKEELKKGSVASYWLNNRNRYVYDGVVLDLEPNSATPDAINLWRGYGVEENTTGDWSLMREHVRKVIANGKKDRFDYIIKWIAWALQHATDPCEVALILKSATHGTGKGMLLRAVRKLFGAHAMQISKGGLLTGRFNAHLAMTCFLFVDEMTLADNQESATLNSTLTEDAIPVEPKGIDAYMMPNHVKVAASSNQEHVVLVAGSDRRFMIFEVSDKHARDTAYFKAIDDQMKDGGYGRMLHDLLAIDLGEWHPRLMDCRDDKDPEKIDSAAPEIQWLAGYLNSGVLDEQVEDCGTVVSAGAFYENARRTTRALASWSDYQFGNFLDAWGCKRKRSNGIKWVFPPLADMRAAFHAKFPWWPEFDLSINEWHDSNTPGEEDPFE